MLPTGKMGNKGFAARLMNGIRRFLAAVGDYWRRRATPPGPGQDPPHADQR